MTLICRRPFFSCRWKMLQLYHSLRFFILISAFTFAETVAAAGCADGKMGSYRGDVSTTITGEPCVYWDDIQIQALDLEGHNLLEKIRLELDLNDSVDHNKCRNPEAADDPNPWCYVKGSYDKINRGDKRWAFCKVDICSGTGCYDRSEDKSRPYNGTLSKAINGQSCLYWNDTRLPVRALDGKDKNETRAAVRNDIKEIDGTFQHNFCRNPKTTRHSNDPDRPFCYTNYESSDDHPDIRWEFCSILFCFYGIKPMTTPKPNPTSPPKKNATVTKEADNANNLDKASSDSRKGDAASTSPVAGIVIGIILLILIIVICIILVCFRTGRLGSGDRHKMEEEAAPEIIQVENSMNETTLNEMQRYTATADNNHVSTSLPPAPPAAAAATPNEYADMRAISMGPEKDVQELDIKMTDEIRFSKFNNLDESSGGAAAGNGAAAAGYSNTAYEAEKDENPYDKLQVDENPYDQPVSYPNTTAASSSTGLGLPAASSTNKHLNF